MSRPIGVLRPQPGADATAARISAAGRRALCLPLFAIRPVAWTPPPASDFDSLLVSSANVFRHGGRALATLRRLPVHAVGTATTEAARAAGFTIAATGEAGIEALRPHGRVLRLTGREHHPLPGLDHVAIVYATEPLSPDLAPLADGVALVHSARAGERLRRLCAQPGRVAVAAISRAAADAAGPGWRQIIVADRPSDAALVAAALPLTD